jgi:hypothetical protein
LEIIVDKYGKVSHVIDCAVSSTLFDKCVLEKFPKLLLDTIFENICRYNRSIGDLDFDVKFPNITNNYKASVKHTFPPSIRVPDKEKIKLLLKLNIDRKRSLIKSELNSKSISSKSTDIEQWYSCVTEFELILGAALCQKKNNFGILCLY